MSQSCSSLCMAASEGLEGGEGYMRKYLNTAQDYDIARVCLQIPTGFEIVQKVWDNVPWP